MIMKAAAALLGVVLALIVPWHQYIFAFVVGAAVSYVLAEKGAPVKRTGQKDALAATVAFTASFSLAAVVMTTVTISTHAAAAIVAFVVGCAASLFVYITLSKRMHHYIHPKTEEPGPASEPSSPPREKTPSPLAEPPKDVAAAEAAASPKPDDALAPLDASFM